MMSLVMAHPKQDLLLRQRNLNFQRRRKQLNLYLPLKTGKVSNTSEKKNSESNDTNEPLWWDRVQKQAIMVLKLSFSELV